MRFHRNPDSTHGFCGAALSANIIHLWKETEATWKWEKIFFRGAEDAGMKVVMNRCPEIELFRPFWKPKPNLGI